VGHAYIHAEGQSQRNPDTRPDGGVAHGNGLVSFMGVQVHPQKDRDDDEKEDDISGGIVAHHAVFSFAGKCF
jgi:hypothetical protein